jgi:hypothetical protein
VNRRSYFYVVVLLGLLWLSFTQIIFGNPIEVVPPERPIVRIIVLINMYFFGAWIEYAYFNSKFYQKIGLEYVQKSNYKLFLRINLVTFPLTQILAYIVNIYFSQFFWFYVFLIEIGVVLIETYLLRLELNRIITTEISPKILLRNTFSANLISFLVGLFAFFPAFF